MGESFLRRWDRRVRGCLWRYWGEPFKENWGAPFIVAFMVLLVVAAASLSLGSRSFADEVAVYAYYALVAGVVLQLICFLRYREKDGVEAEAV